MEKVTLGQIINVVGLQGEFKIKSLSHFSNLRYRKGATVFIEMQSNMVAFQVKQHRHQDGIDFVILDGIHDRTKAESFKGLFIFANKEEIKLSESSYFYGDLIGCEVMDHFQQSIGKVTRLEEHGVQVHLRIARPDKRSLLLPFLNVFILHVDIENKKIMVDLWDGMV